MNEPTKTERTQATDYLNELVFWLNGGKVVIPDPDPAVLLVEFLHSIGLTGTKVGCGQWQNARWSALLAKPSASADAARKRFAILLY